MRTVSTWPLEAGLVAFLAHIKREAWDRYRFEAIVYAIAGGDGSPPRLPAICSE